MIKTRNTRMNAVNGSFCRRAFVSFGVRKRAAKQTIL